MSTRLFRHIVTLSTGRSVQITENLTSGKITLEPEGFLRAEQIVEAAKLYAEYVTIDRRPEMCVKAGCPKNE